MPRPKRTTCSACTTSRCSPPRWPPSATIAPGDVHRRLHPRRARCRPDRPEVVAITAAMPGPTGLLPFQAEFPDRFFDVGIAEQHAVTAAAGMAMAGLRPVVAIYSTFFSRAFDQANLDVGLHGLPVVFALDRAGITGDDGPSHHGVLDLSLTLSIPGMTVFAPSSAQEVGVMLEEALSLGGPSAIRFPKTPARQARDGAVGSGLSAPPGPSGRRHGVPAGGGQAGRGGRRGGRQAGHRRRRRHGVGRPGGVAPRPRHARRRRHPRPGRHDGGRHPGGRRRHVPRRRHAGPQPSIDHPLPPVCVLGVPPATSPRASPTGSWPSSAWTAPASPRP